MTVYNITSIVMVCPRSSLVGNTQVAVLISALLCSMNSTNLPSNERWK